MSEPKATKATEEPKAKAKDEAVVEPIEIEQEHEELEHLMGDDEFYTEGYVDKPLQDSSISRRNKQFYGCYGMQSHKRYNLHYLEDNVIIYAAGNTYQIYNIDTHQKQIFHGQDTDGIGSIAVHPSRNHFAVAEKGKFPNIYIYEYPSLKLYRILKKGTENIYAHIEFSSSGHKLASIGGNPDYTLTVWDWKSQKVILKTKAFSQEVFRASFSPFTDDTLFTSGSGHIRFWRMAKTFTGLKLQGEIGKFGQLELSDVTGFAELPDGKIVSGTEYGTLILWEGNLVKAHLVLDQEKKTPLHNGMIELVLLNGDHFITVGGDGYIKWWNFADIDNAEADEIVEVVIKPVREKLIKDQENQGEPAYLVNMIKGKDHWLLQDGKGRILKMKMDTLETQLITHFHSGKISDLIVSQKQNFAVTIGQDGQVKLWDFIRDQEHYSKRFVGRGTCSDLLSYSEANQGRVIAVGFDNGIVRILMLGGNEFTILKTFKAHDNSVVKMKYSPDQEMLVTASRTGELFFFEINGQNDIQKYQPLCMIQLQEGSLVNDLQWDANSNYLLIGCQNGLVHEIRRPKESEIDNTETFLVDNVPIRDWKIKMMEFQMKKNQKKDEEEEEKKRRMRLRGELPKEEEEEEEDWDPEPILACNYCNDNSGMFIISSQGLFSGYIYVCDFSNQRPLKAIEIPKQILCKFMETSPSGDFLALGFDNGEVQIRCFEKPEKFMSIKKHDAQQGKITAIKFDKYENFILSTSEDGLMFAHLIDRDMIKKEAVLDLLEDVENLEYIPEEQQKEIQQEKWKEFLASNPPNFKGIDQNRDGIDKEDLSNALKFTDQVNDDILDPSQYSIQQAKLRTEEDHRLKLACQKKESVKDKIKQLRQAFRNLRERNHQTEEWIKLTEEEFNIDPVYFNMLSERNEFKIEETKKEVAWGIEYHTVRLNKLKSKFYDCLEFEKFTVKAIRTSSYVTTFRVHKMSEFLTQNIEMFKLMLEQELNGNNAQPEFDEEIENLDSSNLNQTLDAQKLKDQAGTKTSLVNKKQQPNLAAQQKKTEAEKKREERKLQREARKKKIEKLEKKEAMHSGEDPEDRKMIEQALLTYGDFKLKLAASYVVPENQRINYSKKRQQMILLEGSIHKLKLDFNKMIQELKLRKREIIETVKRQNVRLGEINQELNEEVELFEPSIQDNVENPDKFFEITDQDIEQYRKAKIEKEKAAAAAKKTNLMGSKKQAQQQQEQTSQVQGGQQTEAQKAAEAKTALDKAVEEKKKYVGVERKGRKQQESDLDDEVKQIKRIELTYERNQLNDEIDSLINSFDDQIKEMQKEKYRLESDLKNAEMKLITFYEELILLKSMEGKDQDLTQRLAACRQEKGQILREINEISKSLREKKKEIDEIKEKEDQLTTRFHELCAEGSDKYDEIRKYYEKINKKRKYKKEVQNEKNDEDQDEDEQEEDDQDDDEEEEEDDNNIVSLPQDEYKIDEIEKLREERNDLYYKKDEILQDIGGLENNRKKLENKEKNIKIDLEETEEEIQDFQKEKMAKLNQLDVAVVLKIKQLQNLGGDESMIEKWRAVREKEIEHKQQELQNSQMDGDHTMDEQQRLAMLEEEDWRGYYLPQDLKSSILYTRTQLLQLINRKRELDEEQINLDKQFKEYKRDHNQKKKEIKENEKIRAEKEREYNERQMLRFGNLVDLDNLEISGPSNTVLELQNKFAKTEKKCIKLIEEADGELEKTQRDLTQSIKNNTNLLNLIRQLGEEQLDLNKRLDSTNKAIFVDEDDEDKKKNMQEKEKLKEMLEVQAKEIEILKTEINLYKRKGGHIYTKVSTNRRVANLNQNE